MLPPCLPVVQGHSTDCAEVGSGLTHTSSMRFALEPACGFVRTASVVGALSSTVLAVAQ